MTLLTIIQDVTDDLGLSRPTAVIGNTDRQIRQLLRIANAEGRNLASRYRWTDMVIENLFTLSTASRDQGKMNSVVVTAGDFKYIIPDTMWDRTTSLPIPGGIKASHWQTLQSFPVTGPYLQFRINQQKLFIDPVPPAADQISFEYKSKFWCETSGSVGKVRWANDDDTGILDEDLMILGIIWRWLKRKGLEYAEDEKTYEDEVTDAMARDGGKSKLLLNSRPTSRVPGVFVPRGSWPL